ncbi:MAG TPA: SCO6880 family protein [Microbacteriaceae bacterium]|jgi:hypothetical protein|nr:SCO6880 family protein [Microbacteriaceae bacterium]
MTQGSTRRYRFGPLERRGLIGALRATQVVVMALALLLGVLAMRATPTGLGVLVAFVLVCAAGAFCFWPIAGRPAEEWLPIALRHLLRRGRGRSGYRSTAPTEGFVARPGGPVEEPIALPETARDLELLQAPLHGELVGVVKDRRARTYTATLAVKVASFGLLDHGEQESRQAGWGSVIAGLAREGSPTSRVQWIERTVPADGDEIGRYLGEAWDRDVVPLDSLEMQSYLELVSAAPAATKDHELLVSLQIDAKRAWRQIRRTGGRDGADAGACTVLLRELEALAERLSGVDVRVVGALRPGMLASALRIAYDPWSRPGLARLAAADPERDGSSPGNAWPVATETAWTSYRSDGALHSTYWIAGWPRSDVGAAFLAPLLLESHVVRAIGVTMEPVSPMRAIREVEAARTTDAADNELRRRMGFVETARRRRVAEATQRREEELADGHAAVRFAGFVTVSARNEEELERHCSEIEHAAQMARLELVRLFGLQDAAFTYTLPFCRGLR